MSAGPEQSTAERPRLRVPWTALDWVLEAAGIGLMIITILLPLLAWDELPARIPIHFDLSGQPDRWGSRTTIWVLPLISAGLWALLTAVNRFPHAFNYPWPITAENAARQYGLATRMMRLVKVECVLLLAYLTFATIQAARGTATGPALPVLLGLGSLLLLTLLGYLVRASRQR